MEVLEEAVSGGQIAKLTDQLPEDYEPLLSSGSSGQLRR